MKECSKCKISKDLDSFGNNAKKSDGKQNWCRDCVNEYNTAYYKRTPEKNTARKANKAKAVNEGRAYVIEYLSKNTCIDCGEPDWVVLTFDHVRGNKLYNVGTMVANGHKLEAIIAEIDKCVVRCANCHQRKTAKQFGWYKGFIDLTG